MAIGRLLERLYVSIFADTKGVTQGLNEAVRETSRATKQMSDDWVRVGGVIDRTATRIQRGTAVATGASNAFVRSTNQQRAQLQNLGYQINDIGVSLASGMALMTVAIQQGSQIQQIYAGQGGFKALLVDLAGFARMLAPAAIAAGVAAGGVYLFSESLSEATGRSISMTETVVAGFQVVGKAIWELIDGPVSTLKSVFAVIGPIMGESLKVGLNLMIGLLVFFKEAAILIWTSTWSEMRDLGNIIFNNMLTHVESVINGLIKGLEVLQHAMAEIFGHRKLPISKFMVDLSGNMQEVSAEAETLAELLDGAFGRSIQRDYLGEFYDAVKAQAVANSIKKIGDETEGVATRAGAAARDIKENFVDPLQEASKNFTKVFTDAFENFVRTGKLSFREILLSLNSLIAESVGKQLHSALSNSLTNIVGGSSGLLSGVFTSLFGAGAGAGAGAAGYVPMPSVGAKALGGLEMPWNSFIAGERGAELITQSGRSSARRIHTAGQTRNMAGRSPTPVVANFNFYGPTDAGSVRRSQTQITSGLRRAVNKGGRND